MTSEIVDPHIIIECAMIEQWKDIEGWPLHQISNHGRVRALPGARIQSRIIHDIEFRVLARTANNYLQVSHGTHDKQKHHYVHQLVLKAFGDPRPSDATDVRHLNGNRADNRIENLAWGSRADNEADKIFHGRSNRGERHGNSKLTITDVCIIRQATGPRGFIRRLAKQYGVSQSTISAIRLGYHWQHVSSN